MITDELIEYALPLVGGRKIDDMRAGLGYTCVTLTGGGCGLAYTFRNELGHQCGVLAEAGNLQGMDAAEIITWTKSPNPLRAALGLAAINAVLNDPGKAWPVGNVMSAFTLTKSDTFGMVGEFGPILSKVGTMTDNIYVFEQHVPEGSSLYPEEKIPELLPKCGTVVVTATTLINHTADGVLACCRGAKDVFLVGPSTPLCPEVLRRHGVTVLAGSVVKDPPLALRIIGQGGGTMHMKPCTNQVLVRIQRL